MRPVDCAKIDLFIFKQELPPRTKFTSVCACSVQCVRSSLDSAKLFTRDKIETNAPTSTAAAAARLFINQSDGGGGGGDEVYFESSFKLDPAT